MPSDVTRVLVVEDNRGDARLVEFMLREGLGRDVETTLVPCLADGVKHLAEHGCDVVLLDLSLPDSRGLETFLRLREATGDLPVVVLTGFDDADVAVSAVQQGAQDYLVKGAVDAAGLARAVRYAIERHRLRADLVASERRFRHIVEQVSDGILIVDQAGLVRLVNPAAESLLGLEAAGLLDQPPSFPVDSRFSHDFELTRPDGTKVAVECCAADAQWNGEPALIVALHDLTALRKAELERAVSLRLQGVLELAATTCHLLSQPLQILYGFVPECRDAAATGQADPELFEVMAQQIERLSSLARKLSGITRYETQEYPGALHQMIDIDRAAPP
jgi:CheY-like chemotaxis protein